MCDYIKNNKSSQVYWLKENLNALNVKITIKSQRNIALLPSFEHYVNLLEGENIPNTINNEAQEFTFKWQEKVFSQHDYQKYSNIHNCITELDTKLYEMIANNDKTPQKVFTYIHEEFVLPLPVVDVSLSEGLLNINSCMQKVKLNDKLETVGGKTISRQNLFKSNDTLSNEEDCWVAMHIFYDNSEYDEEVNTIYREECLLLSLFYHPGYNYLMVSPDINILDSYVVEASSRMLDLEYLVDIDFGLTCCGDDLVEFLAQLYKKLEEKKKAIINFAKPSLGIRKCYVFFEIATAQHFDMDNIYIEYNIKIPDNIQCKSDLTGRTHVSRSLSDEDIQVWTYGHNIDLELDVNTGIDQPHIKIYFEAISQDRWGRQRTEGYSYLTLLLQPGYYTDHLSCSRPEELNEIDAESRRFFVGGCNLIHDMEVIEKPQLYATNFRFVSTGAIKVTWTTMIQSHFPGSPSTETLYPGVSLLQGADDVLKQYKRAKATLDAATRSISESDSD
ncbi:unnamed protein product [Leptosia nina]|uniref:Meckel syndrome type 1 protein n=1 Tax=Leptosia nina TaxID=320188 RepID=A0AAV1J0D4_9NEOP